MNLDKLTYFSYLSIKHNLLLPLKKFMSFNYKKKFFPLPFFLSAGENDIKRINNKKLDLFYEKKKIGRINVKSISIFQKDLIINFFSKKIKKFYNHPYYDYLKNSKDFIIETSEFNTKRIDNKNKKYLGFATRNIPHKGHEKIVKHFSKRNNVLVLVTEDTSKNKKINSDKTILAYKSFVKKNNLTKKVDIVKIYSPSFLLGPRQAAIHAIIGKNLNCKKFIIGRDHSGYKNFYKTFESFKFCKKYERKINVKIIESGSPVYCKSCKKIIFRKNCNCNNFIDISASLIRKTKNKNLKKILTNF
jgi:ATP sulfurylase